jgi:hypothetical protein
MLKPWSVWAAELVAANDRGGRVCGDAGEGSQGCGLSQRPVGSVGVEVLLVLAQHASGVGGVDDQDPVEEFSADSADEPFGDRVRPRRPHRDLDDLCAIAGEYGIEGGGESGVTVPDQEPDPAAGVAYRIVEVHQQVAGLLHQPGYSRMRGYAEDPYPTGGLLDLWSPGGTGRRPRSRWLGPGGTAARSGQTGAAPGPGRGLAGSTTPWRHRSGSPSPRARRGSGGTPVSPRRGSPPPTASPAPAPPPGSTDAPDAAVRWWSSAARPADDANARSSRASPATHPPRREAAAAPAPPSRPGPPTSAAADRTAGATPPTGTATAGSRHPSRHPSDPAAPARPPGYER